MIKKAVLGGFVLIIFSLILWGVNYLALFQSSLTDPTPDVKNSETPGGGDSGPVDYVVEEMVRGLEVPWSIEFASENRILVAERPGRVREIVDGELKAEPLMVFDEVHSQDEEGLMGLVKHPDYETNGWLYVCLAYEKTPPNSPLVRGRFTQLVDKVVRFVDPRSSKAKLSEESLALIIDDIPAARFHAGCRLKFGPDGKLYVTTGDATDKDLAQDLGSLAGKILRLNDDGSIPDDNPFPNSPVYSYGHRNPQGITWDSEGRLWQTEHGPSVFDGPAGGDEVNLIVAGGNYGWPLVSHERKQSGLISPKLIFTPAEAPGSAMVYGGYSPATPGVALPQFAGNLFFGALFGEKIVRIVFDEVNPEKIAKFESLDLKGVNPGRIRDVVEGPDGAIYFSTSNRDGRGEVRDGDDKIYRLRTINM